MMMMKSSLFFLTALAWTCWSSNAFQLRRPVPFSVAKTKTTTTTTTTSTSLNLADEIQNYRQGLSKINNSTAPYGKPHTETVFKFGGSSLADASRVDYVANLIKNQISEGYRPRAVVCSAMGKTTNNLLSAGEFALDGRVSIDAIRTLHKTTMETFEFPQNVQTSVHELLDECEQMLTGVKMIQELSPKSLDQLVSYGERCSVRIMAARLNQLGVPAQAFDAWEVGIRTDSTFGDAKLLEETEGSIQKSFERIDPNVVAIVTGFIGHDPKGKITTLGRGGSDLTATALGAALRLDEIQVWKDVDGILTTDPRIVAHAIPLDHVRFDEAAELAYFGAQVLHPIAMQPAMKRNIPVRVKNSYNPSAVGTLIQHERPESSGNAKRLVTAITYKRGITVLDIHSTQMLGAYGFLARVFADFEKHKLSVDVLASSEVSVSLTLDKKQDVSEMQNLINDLKDCAEITRKDNMSILTLITDVEYSSEVLATVFRVFSNESIKVEMMSQGASKVNISFILSSERLEDAIKHLHSCFFENECVVSLPNTDDKDASVNSEEEKKEQLSM